MDVANHTVLNGGLITSTQDAEINGKNQFITQTLSHSDIENRSRYEGEGLGVNGGLGFNVDWGLGEKAAPQSSHSRSGINTQNRQIGTDATGEQTKAIGTEITTETAAQHSGSLKNAFDKDKVQQELDLQVQVSQDFNCNGQSALAEINTKVKNALDEAKVLEKQVKEVEARGDTVQANQLAQAAQVKRQSANNWQKKMTLIILTKSNRE